MKKIMKKKNNLSKRFCFNNYKKSEKGSVVMFVTVSCIFIVGMLVILFMNLQNKKQAQSKQIDRLVEQYEVTQQDMERTYQEKSVNM